MVLKKQFLRLTQAHWLFAIIALVFGIFFIIVTPPLWGSDEGAHFFRAYQISKGEFSQNIASVNGKSSSGGLVPASFVALDTYKVNDIKDNPTGNPTKQVDSLSAYGKIGGIPINKDQQTLSPYGAIIYPIVTYAAPAIGMAIVSHFNPTAMILLYAARIATLILYILLVMTAIFLIRLKTIRWIVFLVALLPMSLFQASVVSADSPLLGLSLLFFSLIYFIYNSRNNISIKYVISITLAAILITVIKPPYVILVFVLLFLPINKGIPRRARLFIKIGIPALCFVVAALCTFLATRHVVDPTPHVDTLSYVNPRQQLHWIIDHPFNYIQTLINSFAQIDWVSQTIGVLGSSFVIIPAILSQFLIIILALTAFLDSNKKAVLNGKNHSKYTGVIFLCIGILVVLGVITTLYLTWSHVGGAVVEGVQGRYFLPAVVFILFGIRMLTRARLSVTNKKATIFYSAVVIFCLLTSVLWYHKILY